MMPYQHDLIPTELAYLPYIQKSYFYGGDLLYEISIASQEKNKSFIKMGHFITHWQLALDNTLAISLR